MGAQGGGGQGRGEGVGVAGRGGGGGSGGGVGWGMVESINRQSAPRSSPSPAAPSILKSLRINCLPRPCPRPTWRPARSALKYDAGRLPDHHPALFN